MNSSEKYNKKRIVVGNAIQNFKCAVTVLTHFNSRVY